MAGRIIRRRDLVRTREEGQVTMTLRTGLTAVVTVGLVALSTIPVGAQGTNGNSYLNWNFLGGGARARGMGGNIQQWALNENVKAGRRWQMIRGVSWPQSHAQSRASFRTAATKEYVNFTVGFRLAGVVKL